MNVLVGCLVTLLAIGCAHAPAGPAVVVAPPQAAQKGDDLLYYVLLDRFADGDQWNNESFDVADQQAFHGGDLEGVVNHLDHLSGLGVGSLWLSPVFEARDEKIGTKGAYHGSWTTRFDQLEPRFASPTVVEALARGAKQRHMRVVLEMGYNSLDQRTPMRAEHPDWFHLEGAVQAEAAPPALEAGWVQGQADLDHDNPDVYAWLRDQTLHWMDAFGADGIAIDDLRRLPPTFVRRLVADVRATRPDAWFLGRARTDDPAVLAATLRDTGVDAVMDHPLREALVDVFCEGQPVGRLAATLALDRVYDDPRHQLVTFLDDGQSPRIASECADHGRGPDDVHQALAVLLASRGTPAVTYGTEFGLTGQVPPFNQGDVSWSAAQPYASTLREFTTERRTSPALVDGEDWLFYLDDPDVFAMARVAPDQAVLVLVNRGEEQAMVRLPLELADGAVMSTFHEVVEDQGPFLRHQMVANAPERSTPRLRPFFLVGRSTVVAYVEPAQAGGFGLLVDELRRWRTEKVPVVFEVDDGSVAYGAGTGALSLGPGDRAVVVGSGPELGSWRPEDGLQLSPGPLGTWVTDPTDVPAWTVLDWSIGVVRADGRVVVEEGLPRTTLVGRQDGGAPLNIRVSDHHRGPRETSPG